MNEAILDRLSDLSHTGAAEALALETNHPGEEWEPHACEPAGCPTPGACSAAKEIADLRQQVSFENGRALVWQDACKKAEAERDDADRRAGAAGRQIADIKRALWLALGGALSVGEGKEVVSHGDEPCDSIEIKPMEDGGIRYRRVLAQQGQSS